MEPVFEGLVEYAGLFPPASRTMAAAVAEYADHLAGPDQLALGRFVVAASRLDELAHAAGALLDPPTAASPWRLAVVLGANVRDELALVETFVTEPRHAGLVVEAVELKVANPGEVAILAGALPPGLLAFYEVPLTENVTDIIAAIAAVNGYAKVRTGGITPEAFPGAEGLTRFLMAVVHHQVPFKATAGLHHPFRGSFPLTYAPDAAQHVMYGFINLLLATAELVGGGDGETAQALLEETDPEAVVAAADGWRWRDRHYPDALLRTVRARHFLNFGSCSFREPMASLHARGHT
jgi:hypothetical protein